MREYLVLELKAQESKQERLPKGLASFVHQHCEGNPLFMIAMLEHLIAQGFMRQDAGVWQLRSALSEIDLGVPLALSEMIEMQIDRLEPADQRLLSCEPDRCNFPCVGSRGGVGWRSGGDRRSV